MSDPNVFVKPALGPDGKPVLVRDVFNKFKPLDAAGEWKPRNEYWLRRLRDNDVVEAQPPAAPTVPPAPAA